MSLPSHSSQPGALNAAAQDESVLHLNPADAEDILRLLCSGPAPKNRSTWMLPSPFRRHGAEAGVEPAGLSPNKFCERARASQAASEVCAQWYSATTIAYHHAGGPASPQVVECPFGSWWCSTGDVSGPRPNGLVTGNWRQSGSEGLIYFRLAGASIPPKSEPI